MKALRIVCVVDLWEGSVSRALTAALMRMGHSVITVQEHTFFPQWHSLYMRGLRKLIAPLANREVNTYALQMGRYYRPHLFLVCKGWRIKPKTVCQMRRQGTITINWYPDTGYFAYDRYIPKTLPYYDWIFTTKSFGIQDMKKVLGIENVSLLNATCDPEIHAPWKLDEDEQRYYGSDVTFIGTWTPRKQAYIEYLLKACPDLDIKVWGRYWKKKDMLQKCIQGHVIIGREYAKAICAAKIALGLLMRTIRKGASSGDFITSRSFNIPASGGFMLHERTDEILQHFTEDEEIACFSTPEEMVEKVRFFLAHEDKRRAIAQRGMEKSRNCYNIEVFDGSNAQVAGDHNY
jgi:spore maturation protein CgeB